MSRRKRVLKRPIILPDNTFGSVLVSRLINRVMWSGKKTIATKIVNDALTTASQELQLTATELLDAVVKATQPSVEVITMRVGGSNYQVPMEPRPERALRLSLTWIVNGARSLKGKPMNQKLAQILVESYNGQGPAVQKKEAMFKTAQGNKAYSHLGYRAKKKTA
jgi:small subunit ribosomal protein S7